MMCLALGGNFFAVDRESAGEAALSAARPGDVPSNDASAAQPITFEPWAKKCRRRDVAAEFLKQVHDLRPPAILAMTVSSWPSLAHSIQASASINQIYDFQVDVCWPVERQCGDITSLV